MRRWILVDYDQRGLLEIQARDEHPLREVNGVWYGDDEALALARRQASQGDKIAIDAVAQHDRDAAAIKKIRARN